MRNPEQRSPAVGTEEASSPDIVRPGPVRTDEEPIFSAVLTPHRSLSPTGFLFFMGAVVAVSFAAGIAFFLMGAWPVTGFFGLDALLIYLAFRLNYRAGRLYETVDLTGDTLRVTRVSATGRARSWTFNPYWARCEIAEQRGGARHLYLASHGKKLIFGSFLSPEEKADFADALSGALRESRGGDRV